MDSSPKPGNTRPLPSLPRVVFGFDTALQIHRSINKVNMGRASSHVPSTRPPKRELRELLQQLCTANGQPLFDLPVHLLMGSAHFHANEVSVPHLCRTLLPRKSIRKLSNDAHVASANLALCQIASTTSDLVPLLLLLWEACGTYCTQRTGLLRSQGTIYNSTPLTSVRALKAFCARCPSLRGSRKLSRALRYVADNSASPRETSLALLLGLPERLGGYNLGIPHMNKKVIATEQAFAVSGKRFFRCDLCWPGQKIDLEYQSRHSHEGEAKRIEDSRRTNALASMGWNVIEMTNDEASSISTLNIIANSLRKALGKRTRAQGYELGDKRLELCKKLGLISWW